MGQRGASRELDDWLDHHGYRHSAKTKKQKVSRTPAPRQHHATVAAAPSPGRWNHRNVAKRYEVAEDVVRRIYAAVQTAKKQGLHGGYYLDLLDRSLGRKIALGAGEYTVALRAKEHLGYDPPGGYGGPEPKGSAKVPRIRAKYDDPKMVSGRRIEDRAEHVIRDVLRRRRHPVFGWDESNDANDRVLLREAADELDVAADLYEEAGAGIHAGTLRERGRLARHGDYRRLDAYS